jgi:hypothetical protein
VAALLIMTAVFFIRNNYQRLIRNFKTIFIYDDVYAKIFWVVIKSILVLSMIFGVRSLIQFDYIVWAAILFGWFVVFSFLQSSYSRAGLVTRIHIMKQYFQNLVKESKTILDTNVYQKNQRDMKKYLLLVKLVLFFFIGVVNVANLSWLLFTNVLQLVALLSIVLLTFILNNVFYFGVVAYIILLSHPGITGIGDINWIIVSYAFFTILIGMIFEMIFEEKMLIITQVRLVKDYKSTLEYEQVYDSRTVVVFQNPASKEYYVYYRTVGFVVVFESYYNAKQFRTIMKKMIHDGKRFLLYNKVEFE